MSGIRGPLVDRYDRDLPVAMVSVGEFVRIECMGSRTSASTSTTTSYPRFAIAMVVYDE